jgi:RHS repeat-associated protein
MVVTLAAVCVGPFAAFADASEGAAESSLTENTFTPPGSPTESEQRAAEEEAKAANPEAIAERETSGTKYEGLNSEQAARADQQAFPVQVDDVDGGPPTLPAGQAITGYPTDHTAQLNLGNGKRGLLESTVPLALETSPGQWSPVSLALGEVNGAFESKRPVVGVRIPKKLSEGVQLRSAGVSLTPVDASGAPLNGAEGVLEGADAFYANTQTDMDDLVKPTTEGFAADTVLRSVASPEQLSFHVGMPAGAELVQPNGALGPILVVKEGTTLAIISAPTATDAAGTQVPVTLSLSGATLTMTVAHPAGAYQYPILVDPTVEDPWVDIPGNWAFATSDPSEIKLSTSNHYIEGSDPPVGEWGLVEYPTQGASRIYEWVPKIDAYYTPKNRNSAFVENPSKRIESNGGALVEITGEQEVTLCVEAGCAVPKVTAESQSNTANIETMVKERSSGWMLLPFSGGKGVYIVQEAGPTFGTFNTSTETTSTGLLNGLYGHKWENTASGRWGLEASATDPGLGIKHAIWKSPNASKWGTRELGESEVPGCKGEQCSESASPTYSLKEEYLFEPENLPDGEDTVELKVEDPVGLTATGTSAKIKVDNTPPHNITLTGLPSTHEISDGEHVSLTASATDGSGPESSGVASIVLAVDGQQVGGPSGGCSPGTCTAKGEWTLSAENYSAGKHTITVTATDNAGNVATEAFELTIHHAAPVAVGPGAVNPVTGELSLGATDVAVNAPDGALTVARTYRSRHLGSLAEGPLGPQWALSLGASESLYKTPSGNMVLTGPSGEELVFTSNGTGGYTSPPGDAGMSLSASGMKFLLTENGAVTTFSEPTGGSGSVWEPSVSEGAGGTDATTFAYRTEGGVTEPTEELAPVPSGVSCSPTLNKGCRALSFVYAEKTKESIGESQSEWGEYKGRLKEVLFTAYEPSSKEMKAKAVAEYYYDKQGRLRAEWNPQISPSLKTTYGYDAAGHVTALAEPGQQPWLIEQGTAAKDGAPGRVLAVARTAATTEAVLKTELEASPPVNTVVPTLSSTTPTVGVKISVSTNGTWSNSPLAYSYQWDDCNTSGKECTAIPGAVNQAYYPVTSDEGHTLVAEVVALNANGSVTASSGATSKVAAGTPSTPLPEPPSVGTLSVWTLDYEVPLSGTETALPKMSTTEVAKWGQTDDPAEAMAVFPPDKPMGWPAKEYTRATIYYLDGRDRAVNLSTPFGGISTTEYNLDNDVTRTLTPDNRATALAAGEAKSKELAEELASESTYNETGSEPGTEILSALGPKHTVQLASGAKVEARAHTVYGYNEGAPSEGGPYRLPTKITQGAQYSGGEEDVRTTKTSYSGQENLGWTLRKPTSVSTNPSGLNLTHTTFYEPTTGNVVETRTPAGGTGNTPAGGFEYLTQVAAIGEAACTLAMKTPNGVAFDSSGDIWVVDTGNDRVSEISSAGKYLLQVGSEGTTTGKFKEPRGIAIDKEGHVWVADTGNNRIQEFSSKGVFMKAIGSEGAETGKFKKPRALAFDSSGNLWVADTGNKRVQEFSATGSYLRESTAFSEPVGIAADAKGHVWVTDAAFSEVIELSSTAGEIGSFGAAGTGNGDFKQPAGITITGETAYVVDSGNNRVEKFSLSEKEGEGKGTYAAKFGTSGTGKGQLKEAQGVTLDKEGHVWVADAGNDRLQEFGASGEYIAQDCSPIPLKTPHGVAFDSAGHVWVADTGNNRVAELSSAGAYITQFGSEGTGNGQFKGPRGVAVSGSDVYVADTGNERVEELSTAGEYIRAFGTAGGEDEKVGELQTITVSPEGDVWVASKGELERHYLEEFSATGTFMRAIELSSAPEGITTDTKDDVWATAGSDVWEYSKTGTKLGEFGGLGSGNGQLKTPAGLAVSGKYVYVSDRGNNRIEEFQFTEKESKTTAEYVSQVGTKGSGNSQFKEPQGAAVDSEGHLWVADSGNNRLSEFKTVAPGPHSTQTIYYSAGANYYAECGEHPEWANLPCRSQPTKQPETTGLPTLPVMIVTYNYWDEPEKTTETVEKGTEKTVRTKTDTYEASGRLEKAAVSSTVGTALPTVTDKYNATLGVLEEQSNEGKTKPITSRYNTLGQLTSYTDAAEGTTTYEYDEDGRIKKVNDGKGTEAFTYSKTSGLVTELLNEYATTKLTFTAAYDPEGNLATEGYPNGMTATYTYNPASEATGLEYVKTTHCSTGCTLYQEGVVPSIHGQDLSQTNTVSGETATDNYTYDADGRLTQVQEIPAGKGCTTRVYAYEQDTNRTSLTTRAPGSEGKCATEGGTEEKHSYDEADRLTDTGTSYDAFGDITMLPAADAGGKEASENLMSEYYADSQLESQTQKEQTIGYKLDPAGRTLEVVSTGKPVASNVVNHYAGPGSAPAWSENTTTSEWTRNISGISGFAAVQVNGAPPVLKLMDLHSNIVATAALGETETKLLSSTAMTEYGVPTTTKPEKYGWLGGDLLAAELPSGTIDMGARSYIPQLGRFLQTDPVPGGSANAYAYTFGDPVNASDPSGEYTASVQQFAIEGAEERAGSYLEFLAKKAAEEAAARAEAERAGQEATAALFTREAEIAGALKQAEASWCGGTYGPCAEEGGGGGYLSLFLRLHQSGLIGEVGNWVNKHVIQPVKHVVHAVEKTVKEVLEHLPKCYPNEIEGGGQCSSAPPGSGGNPWYPFPGDP